MTEFSSRLIWVREKLGLSLKEVASDLEVPVCTQMRRENESSIRDYKQLKRYANYFDSQWQDKYLRKSNFPLYNGRPVIKITESWLMFGYDATIEEYQRYINIISNNYRDKEQAWKQLLYRGKSDS